MDQIKSLHQKEHGCQPDVIVAVPGKFNLMGEYTEFAGGSVISVSPDINLYLSVSLRKDNALRFYSGNLEERKKGSLTGIKFKREDRWANYPKGVIAALQQFGCQLTGADFTLYNQIPEKIGLGASSAFCLATALALKGLLKLELSEVQLIESVRLAEMRYFKLDSGISTPYSALNAESDSLICLDSHSLAIERIPFPWDDTRLLLTNAQISNAVNHDETLEYKQEILQGIEEMISKKAPAFFRDSGNLNFRYRPDQFSEENRRFSQHLIEENQRVNEMKTALMESDFPMAGKLMNRSHESLRDLLEISCPELDWLVKRAQEIDGVYGSRMIGNGFGGCTISLIDAKNIDEYRVHLEEYDRIFGFKAEISVCHLSSGIQLKYL